MDNTKMTRWIVVEWVGKWAVTDKHHGGADAGPHDTEQQAVAAVEKHISKNVEGWRECSGDDVARRQEAVMRIALKVVPVVLPEPPDDSWF